MRYFFGVCALLALLLVGSCALAGGVQEVLQGVFSGGIIDVVKGLADAVFRSLDSAVIVLGVAAVALNQLAQIWAWSKESRMGKIERLIETAISWVYLLKGQALKKEQGKLTLEQGRELAGDALDKLKKDAEGAGINLDKELGDDDTKRARIQTIFDRMRNRLRRERSVPDDSEMVAP